MTHLPCPSCKKTVESKPFYSCNGVPANSVILCKTKEMAESIPQGEISLIHCPLCDFIFNKAFDPQTCVYDQEYEETQTHSEVFKTFHEELASHLINTYQLKNKSILEIGCGKGDFLDLMCRMGNNRGTGFDPAYVAERSQTTSSENVSFYPQFFPVDYDGPQPDCIICKMTLEHIQNVNHFLKRIRNSISHGNNPLIFFQVPDSSPILEESRFWDIYYEHCSYFTADSLCNLFQHCGFQIEKISNQYKSQYLTIEAFPCEMPTTEAIEKKSDSDVNQLVHTFSGRVNNYIQGWQHIIKSWHKQNKCVVIWGGGSKAVAFLTTLNISLEVHSVVDINPHKHGKYLPGTNHRVIAPQELVAIQPDIILAMNPMYMSEIKDQLQLLKIECELLTLDNESLNKDFHP